MVKLRRHLLRLGAAIFHNFNGLFDARVNTVRVQAVFGQQKFGVAVRDNPVGNTHPDDAYFVLQAIFFKQFDDG